MTAPTRYSAAGEAPPFRVNDYGRVLPAYLNLEGKNCVTTIANTHFSC